WSGPSCLRSSGTPCTRSSPGGTGCTSSTTRATLSRSTSTCCSGPRGAARPMVSRPWWMNSWPTTTWTAGPSRRGRTPNAKGGQGMAGKGIGYPVFQLAHVELYTPKPEQSLWFFRDFLGMEPVATEGQSVYLRGYEDWYTYSLKL